jgi:hypothetical protein
LLYKGAEILATASANTATQRALGGEMSGRSLAENALAVVLTSAALRPFHGLLHDSAAVEGQIQTWGNLRGRWAKPRQSSSSTAVAASAQRASLTWSRTEDSRRRATPMRPLLGSPQVQPFHRVWPQPCSRLA